ncbi:DUF6875 domain-containing protein [Streptomyces sp. NPDC018031]|uniref:DUF6875 domain-containing protein n=1 Tax=Streptomyces sp. NPDC018031 TaxID=3365033 RepID=UPI0037AE6A3A
MAVLSEWLHDYIGQPHPLINRQGPVCPFVPAAVNARALRLEFHYGVTGEDPEELGHLLAGRIRSFARTGTAVPPEKTSLESLVIALPELREESWPTLDAAHLALKDTAVGLGAMIGQFHPDCAEPSVRNSGFPVSRSPLPLLAVRHMAVHDILFLHDRPRWFAEFRGRFERNFTDGRVRDPLMLRLYAEAEERDLEGAEQ